MDYFLGVVGIITLALGAIGIINIMLVSVTERTREIGLRKALGATHRAILTQFFVEGAFLTAMSGGIGLAITTLLVTGLAALPAPEGFDTPRIVPSSAAIAISRSPLRGLSPAYIQHAKRPICHPWRPCARSKGAGIIMIVELARQAYNALKYNRRRSVLTMLGMAWGIATVVLLLAYGEGFERGLWVAFRSWGTNLVFIFPGRTSLQAGGTKAGNEIKLTVNDLDYLQAEVPLLKRISPEAFKQASVAYGSRSGNYGISGVYPYYQRMRRIDVQEGTFFSDLDQNSHSRVAILGADVKKKLFSGQNALGEKVRLDGISYEDALRTQARHSER